MIAIIVILLVICIAVCILYIRSIHIRSNNESYLQSVSKKAQCDAIDAELRAQSAEYVLRVVIDDIISEGLLTEESAMRCGRKLGLSELRLKQLWYDFGVGFLKYANESRFDN